ncbi:MAG: STAS domain-containing protein [Clostridia bacterium]|nr:STAS domain-containing protein [Clostridia bacterium]MBR3196802.1 STAS domain-containing protein [Clostridia bacterium]
MLNINKTIEEGKALFALEGRLDTITAPVLEEDLMNSLEGVKDLTLDFEKLDYISSAGLRVLLATQKIMNKEKGEMKVRNLNDTIAEIFELTGFAEILTIE